MKKENKSEYKPSLLKAILRTFGPWYAFLGIFCFFEECIIRVFQPLFMGNIDHTSDLRDTRVSTNCFYTISQVSVCTHGGLSNPSTVIKKEKDIFKCKNSNSRLDDWVFHTQQHCDSVWGLPLWVRSGSDGSCLYIYPSSILLWGHVHRSVY